MKRYEIIYTKGKQVYKKIVYKVNFITLCYYVSTKLNADNLISITLLPSEEG